jgi:predicted CxxxxCH...CXXCH cytochrome family protein
LLTGCSDPNTQAALFNADTGKHPSGWAASHGSSYAIYQNTCHDCHGTDLKGGISDIGCFTNVACHAGVTSCGICHGDPPSGTMFPNTAGAHAVHTALSVGLTCDACHTGAGSGTALHMNYVADVALSNTILTTFKAKSGNVSYNAGSVTCSKISCHGGITTPNWISGAIDVNSQCMSCHTYGTAAQTPEYNSFYSGEHNKHVNGEGIACTSCHDPARLATSHFTNLQTAAMEGPASQTIYLSIQYNGTTCNNPCHGSETW